MLRRILGLGLVLVLAGCFAAPVPQGHRNGGRQISSAALFDPARFADVWHVVAAYGEEAKCGPLGETWAPTGQGQFRVTGTRCGPNGARAFLAEARVTGPGRITRSGVGVREEIWVLWVDADYRAAVVGTPSGSFARVMSRQPVLRADLMQVARQVLEFNGYDPARLSGL
jgi:apolipoprotein D and lipocalin family protein